MLKERVRTSLDVAASVAMIVASAVLLWSNLGRPRIGSHSTPATPAVPSKPVLLDGSWMRGSSRAAMGVLVYSDFACPYCRSFARATLPSLLRNYVDPGLVRLAFKHLPLSSIHPHADMLARTAECAGVQGQFWPMHDRLFSIEGGLDPSTLGADVGMLGLDRASFERCMSDSASRRRIDMDVLSASALGIKATPTVPRWEDSARRTTARDGGVVRGAALL